MTKEIIEQKIIDEIICERVDIWNKNDKYLKPFLDIFLSNEIIVKEELKAVLQKAIKQRDKEWIEKIEKTIEFKQFLKNNKLKLYRFECTKCGILYTTSGNRRRCFCNSSITNLKEMSIDD